MNKIQALEATLVKLNDTNVHYAWIAPQSCNCGILAQCVMGKNDDEINEIHLDLDMDGSWEYACKQTDWGFCEITGLPNNVIFDALGGCGFNKNDIVNLERLGDSKVLCRANLNEDSFGKTALIAYITAWIEILKEEESRTITITVSNDAPTKDAEWETEPIKSMDEGFKYVVIDKKIREEAKELKDSVSILS